MSNKTFFIKRNIILLLLFCICLFFIIFFIKGADKKIQLPMKQIVFGFNLGYLADLTQSEYIKPLASIKEDGIINVRTYEPFTKNLTNHLDLLHSLIIGLTNAGFNVLLSLSNFPYKNQNMLEYTNRKPPTDLVAGYINILKPILDILKGEGALDHISFEIGNEPDAKNFFWGSPDEFIHMYEKTKELLLPYKRPIYCCGFTSDFANSPTGIDETYFNFFKNSFSGEDIYPSFHFYPKTSSTFDSIKLGNVRNGAITEFNIFSHQTVNQQDEIEITNSPQFASWMILLLDYTYSHDIKTVYLFRLVDLPTKDGTLGFFDQNGNPKKSYEYFKKIYSVVKDGYSVTKTTNSISIEGKKTTAILSLVNLFQIPLQQGERIIESSSRSINPKILNKDEWVIISK